MTRSKESDRPVTAALYLRVSTAPQERGESLTVQEEELRAFADARGYEAGEVFRDVASGRDRDRPGLAAAVAAAASYDALLVWDITRFGRSAGQGITLAGDLLRDHDTEVLDREGRTSRDPVVFGMLQVLAQYESETIAERTASARRAMAARGEWPTGQPPYGTRVPDDGPRVLQPDEEEAGWIRGAAGKVLEGMTTGQVADWLDAQGAPTPSRGRARWRYPAVAQLLKSPRLHQGWVDWNGSRVGHPRILDEATAAALRAELDSRNPGGQRKPARYPLTGHVFCTCGALWRSWGAYNGPPGSRWYGCARRDRGPASECDWSGPRKALEAGWLEELVWATLMGMMTPASFEEKFAEDDPGDPSADLDAARAGSARLESALSRLYRMAAEADEGAMASAVREAEAELAGARREEQRLATAVADRERALAALGRASSAWGRAMDTRDPGEMARVLDDLGVRVQLRHPGEGDVVAFTVQAELVDEPAVLRVGSDHFEKEMAELEAAEQ